MLPTGTICLLLSAPVAVVGLKNTAHSVSESAAVVMVCIEVRSPSATCPIMFPFSLVLVTGSGSARMYNIFKQCITCTRNAAYYFVLQQHVHLTHTLLCR